ncbi:MAG: hypothetical protein QM708_03150 [Propioniciclava sp.]|uniref:hypothetical protein n=1 Tax=Propioniciclava sp. TaxID=2038686 RepID=UPI0039E45000
MSEPGDDTPRRALPPTDDGAAAPGSGAPRSPRKLIGTIAVAVIAVVVVVAVAWGSGLAGRLMPTPTPTIDPVATYLAQPGDLDGVREGSTWTEVSTSTTVEATTPHPQCLLLAADQTIKPASTLVRTFAPADGAALGLLHQVDQFESEEQAHHAYVARLTQLSECERTTALALSGVAVSGLSDEAAGIKLVLQNAADEYHTILISRTGTRVNIVDATAADAASDAQPLISALQLVSARQCNNGGTCPSDVGVAGSAPPVVEPRLAGRCRSAPDHPGRRRVARHGRQHDRDDHRHALRGRRSDRRGHRAAAAHLPAPRRRRGPRPVRRG